MVISKINSKTSSAYINKKGSSHFEIIISFILFVGFTLFLVLSLTPTKQDLLEESILFGVKNAFFDNATTNVTSVLIDIKKTQGNGNLCPQNKACYPEEIGNSENKIFKEEKECVYYISASQEFPEDLVSDKCKDNENKKNYSLGYIEKQQVISNNTLQIFKKEYYSDYNASKTRFGVPDVVDFAVDFDASDDVIDMTKTVPDGAPVIAGVYRKKVLYGNGSIINQDFIVKVW